VGLHIQQDTFFPADYERFSERLRTCLTALREVLARPGFGEGPISMGAELEMFLVDDQAQPMFRNREVLGRIDDPRVTLELARFNMEVNARPVSFAGRPFAALERELKSLIQRVRASAAEEGARVVLIGILPTLRAEHLQHDALTDAERYRALDAGIRQLRGTPMTVRIDGEDAISLQSQELALQGANTSFQVHLRVRPADFGRVYNAAQIATAPALALAGNSPLFVGHRLWEETRIALFKQTADDRGLLPLGWRAARASFGHGWVRQGPLELFEESVALHAPLLPVCSEEDSLAVTQRGELPALDELRLHHGTVWTWNRVVYDPSAGGHVRIEFRPLPAGPTVPDMLANGAFLLGLTLGLVQEMDWMLPALPFPYADYNFYRAAQHGLGAHFLWPSQEAPSPRPVSAEQLLPTLLPLAERGLRSAGVDAEEVSALLGLLANRLERRQTGAQWQRRALAHFEKGKPRPEALRAVVERYLALSDAGTPVHSWPVE